METKANYLMIGGFVLGVLAFAFIFIFWISNFAGGGTRYLIVFENSVAGLTSGSSVGFNGIKVGEVQTFALDPKDGRKVQVVISVDEKTPVRKDSRAKIQSLGLTGGKGIQITPGTPESPLLVATDKDPIPTIQAARGGGGGLFDAAPAALNSATAFIQHLDDLVTANEDAVNSTMSNVDAFTTMLKNKDEEISQTVKELNESAKSFNELGGKLNQSVDDLTRQAKQGMQDFSAAMQEARRAAVTLNRILEKFEQSPTGFLLRGSRPPDSSSSSSSPPSSSSRGFGQAPRH
jgi:phospholipid/cholesterol/gamma-HCH transport system substrate-binding protein